MKTKLLVERYGTWDVNRYSGKTIHTKTNANAYGRDWADDALKKEDENYNQSNSTYKRPSYFTRYKPSAKLEPSKYALDVPFADKDAAKEEFKKLKIPLLWDKEIENPLTKKKGTWVAVVGDYSNFQEFYKKDGSVSKWANSMKLLK
jgi:hypothetical protein